MSSQNILKKSNKISLVKKTIRDLQTINQKDNYCSVKVSQKDKSNFSIIIQYPLMDFLNAITIVPSVRGALHFLHTN